MAPTAFRVLLLAVVVYALLRGGPEERRAAIISLVATFLTQFLLSPLGERFQDVETSVLVLDLAVLGAFVVIACQSERFWPLWVAGLQLTTVLGHGLKYIESDLFSRAYGAALTFWAYPIVLIIAVGTWRASHNRFPPMQSGAAD